MKQLSIFAKSMSEETQHVTHPDYWKLCVDGAARNNPGPAGAGIAILKNDQIESTYGFYLGKKTNNQAEYLALVIGLIVLQQKIQQTDLVLVLSDSELLVKQIKGEYRVKHPELKPLHTVAKKILASMSYDIAHVVREDNVLADAMANKGVDEKIALTPACLRMLHHYELSL